jgi:hypothetical protein
MVCNLSEEGNHVAVSRTNDLFPGNISYVAHTASHLLSSLPLSVQEHIHTKEDATVVPSRKHELPAQTHNTNNYV